MLTKGALLLALVVTPASLAAAPIAALVDPAQCKVVPAGTVRVEAGVVTVTVQMGRGPQAEATLALREPLDRIGKERLVLEARGEETTGTYLCVSRTSLSGQNTPWCDYEPDLLFPPTWTLREIVTADMPANLPAKVAAIRLHFWAPSDSGREVRFHLRRLDWQSRDEVALELRGAATVRSAIPMARSAPRRSDERWVNLGPGGGGWFRTVAISPHDGTTFVGGDVGGVYRSRDRGRTWGLCNEGITNLYINCFGFHPTDSRVVFAGSNGGPLKSTDGGKTWRLLRKGLPPLMTFGRSAPISSILVERTNPQRVIAGVGHERDYGALSRETVGGRVFLSEDGGENWRGLELPLGPDAQKASVLCLQPHPHDSQVVFAVTQFGLCRSDDRGEHWTRWGSGLDGYRLGFLAIRRDQPQVMLLSHHASPQGRGGVLRSRDGGKTWQAANAGLPAAERFAWRLVADPHDASCFYLGYNSHAGLYVTRDGGDTWQLCSRVRDTRWSWAYAHAICTGLDADPTAAGRLVYCDDLDICQTLDAGVTWESVIARGVLPATAEQSATWQGRGCEILCLTGPQAIAVDPARPRTLFAGYWDLHGWRSDDGGQSFARMVNGTTTDFGRMGAVLLDPANPDVMWISVGANYDQQRIYKSVDAGRTFRLVGHAGSGLPPGGIFTIVLDPGSPLQRRTLFAGVTGYGVYRSTDGGLTWSESSQGLPADSRTIKQIAVDGRDSRRMYVAAGTHYHAQDHRLATGYLAVSEDRGAHWRVVKQRVDAQCIIVDPTDSRRVYAGNRNYSGVDYPNALYRSEDGGRSWSAAHQDIFTGDAAPRAGDRGWRAYVSCLAADPSTPGTLYAGLTCECCDVSNGRGVFVSRDYGASWHPFPATGLTNGMVETLVVDPVDPARLYVGTSGNGLFRWGPAP